MADLIQNSTYELNKDAEESLTKLGEKVIRGQARDIARQLDVYFRMHPNMDINEMRRDPLFMAIALQKVGETGYTAVTEGRRPGFKPTTFAEPIIFRVHPNPKYFDQDLGTALMEKLPEWGAIAKRGLEQEETFGYYNWPEPGRPLRKKYLWGTAIKTRLNGRILTVSATTYIDEFSAPIVDMRKKADKIVAANEVYLSRQLIIFSIIAVTLLLLTFTGTYILGRKEAFRYILPIMHLAKLAGKFGEGEWDVAGDEDTAQREDEIGTLARAFNRMSIKLRELFSSLEQRVAELKQAEDALKASEQHYHSLFDGIPVGMYRTSPEGKIIEANPILAHMLGYPDRATFMGRRADSLYMNPEDREKWQSRMMENGILNSYEKRMRKYDGTEIWVEDNSHAVKDEAGNLLYYEGSLKDTTEQKRAEAALKKSEENLKAQYEKAKRAEELYGSLINSSADAIVICDLESSVIYASPMFTRIFGWGADELHGEQVPFIPESERASIGAVIRDVIDHGRPVQGFESRCTTREGRLINVSLSASRYEDHEGKPAGMLFILRDISEKKRLEAHLQHAERMEAIGTLAGGIAHDFNNLLMVIQGSVSLMLLEIDSSHPYYKNFIDIEKQVQRGAKLTSQLLGYARKGKYELQLVDLNEIMMESIEAFGRTRKDIIIHYHLSPEIHPVEVDVYQIEQVLINLFINAFDAMVDGGDLYLTTKDVRSAEMLGIVQESRPGNYVMLRVEDTGIGMDKKTMDRIFEPFFTTKDVSKGSGLGLASVYGIVQGHGGHIRVESEVGKGSAFIIYFPASEKAVVEQARTPKKILKGKGTILLVDDEDLVLNVGARMLKTLGYTVLKARDGRKAIDIFKKQHNRIDLIVLDMIMPDMSGSQAFDLFREIDPGVAVLLSSGYSIDGKATDILNRGCNGFIQKPFSIEELSEKIKKIIIKEE